MDKLVVINDFNARDGNNVEEWNGATEKHSEGVKNDSGSKLLLRIIAENEFRVMNIHFDHKEIHKLSWK